MSRSLSRRTCAFAAAVTLLGGATIATIAARGGFAPLRHAPAEFWIFAVLAVASDLYPIKLKRWYTAGTITGSTIFVYAILLQYGIGPAVAAHITGSIVLDLRERKGAVKMAFNASQYALSVMAAGAVLSIGGIPHPGADPAFSPTDLPLVLAGAAAYFAVNNTLTGIVAALSLNAPVVRSLRADTGEWLRIDGMLISLSPLVVIVASFGLIVLPLLALPVLAIVSYGRQGAAMEHDALHDRLTDLPNRALLCELARRAVDGLPGEARVGLVVVDVDGFKEINDTLGHEAGDELLRQIGPRLQSVLRPGDVVARIAADEFAVLLPSLADKAVAMAVAEDMIRAVEPTFDVGGMRVGVRASIGVAYAPDDTRNAEELLRCADVARRRAKRSRTGVEGYRTADDPRNVGRLGLMAELRDALDAGEVGVAYQPKVDLTTGRAIGVEALVRWHLPAHGDVPPADFVPVAEQTGLIRPLTLHVLDAAVRQCGEWQRGGLSLSVAVNLSAQSLLDRDLPVDVARILREHHVDPARLGLEVTESSLMSDPERAAGVLHRLASLGVAISIDDFGTGYSSLAHLKSLPVDEIKIDRSFVRDMATSHSDAAIVRSTIDLGRNLGLRVVAEGVEDERALDLLVELGCDLAQGYLLSAALDGDELADWVREHEQSSISAPPRAW